MSFGLELALRVELVTCTKKVNEACSGREGSDRAVRRKLRWVDEYLSFGGIV